VTFQEVVHSAQSAAYRYLPVLFMPHPELSLAQAEPTTQNKPPAKPIRTTSVLQALCSKTIFGQVFGEGAKTNFENSPRGVS
jgi:hypothetical protein